MQIRVKPQWENYTTSITAIFQRILISSDTITKCSGTKRHHQGQARARYISDMAVDIQMQKSAAIHTQTLNMQFALTGILLRSRIYCNSGLCTWTGLEVPWRSCGNCYGGLFACSSPHSGESCQTTKKAMCWLGWMRFVVTLYDDNNDDENSFVDVCLIEIE